MCGLSGFWQPLGSPRDALQTAVRRMADRLAHRGPDDSGEWVDEKAGIALGHRRLAIVDLSNGGHQPMISHSGRYVLAFNGEIYNFRELRAELEADSAAPAWRGHSDTEVMLAAFERWGMEGSLSRFVGMFAIALWDSQERILHLARDRLGEKPLYYGFAAAEFVFASELKALHAVSGFVPRVDRLALAAYVQLACVPVSRSIYEGVCKLAPGCLLSLDMNALARALCRRSVPIGLEQAVGRLPIGPEARRRGRRFVELRLREAVAGQMVADVPPAPSCRRRRFFRSGSADASTEQLTCAHLQHRFPEVDYDEARCAGGLPRIWALHTELYVTPRKRWRWCLNRRNVRRTFGDSFNPDFSGVSARTPACYGELGDAGDELFGGCNATAGRGHSPSRLVLAGRNALSGAIRCCRPR